MSGRAVRGKGDHLVRSVTDEIKARVIGGDPHGRGIGGEINKMVNMKGENYKQNREPSIKRD